MTLNYQRSFDELNSNYSNISPYMDIWISPEVTTVDKIKVLSLTFGLAWILLVAVDRLFKLSLAWETSTSRGRFHQHFMRSFYALRSQKHKKIRTTRLNFYTFGIFVRTLGSCYLYSTDNKTPLTDSLSVQNISIYTSLFVHCTDNGPGHFFVLIKTPRICRWLGPGNVLIMRPPCTNNKTLVCKLRIKCWWK
jgi:hypothetical protein